MSNRLFQGVIHQMRDAIDRTVGVIDESGTVISCSELERIGEQNKTLITEPNSNDPIISMGRPTCPSTRDCVMSTPSRRRGR